MDLSEECRTREEVFGFGHVAWGAHGIELGGEGQGFQI